MHFFSERDWSGAWLRLDARRLAVPKEARFGPPIPAEEARFGPPPPEEARFGTPPGRKKI